MRGTLLNTATVAAGGLLGLAVGKAIPGSYQTVALHGLGLVTCGIGLKMFFQGKNPLITALAIAGGGVLGLAIGVHHGIELLAEWSKAQLGQSGQNRFADGVVTSFVLFCVGPMTLLGCMEDALEKKIELLGVKSTLDGIASVFLAALYGAGILVTAVLLFLFQSALTVFARHLHPIANNEEMLNETVAAGGLIMVATGLGLLEIVSLKPANYLPAIVIAPLAVAVGQRTSRLKKVSA
jgi:uncharacterized membrane protein YqgA involved in biofilm formation